MRILLTRPEADARRSAERLQALGHDVLVCPLFEISATDIARPDGRFHALLATSAHAFDFLPAFENLTDLPLHVVGERTADAARRAGCSQIMSAAPDAKALAIGLARDGGGRRSFLYLAGRERRPELEASLSALGHSVTPWILYQTREAAHAPDAMLQALSEREIDAVLHFSPRSAALYLALAEAAGLRDAALSPRHVVISARAGEQLSGAPDIRIAATPDFAGLVDCLSP